MRGLGYVVSRNKPYAGGFITEHYGNPAVGLHAIQLEINRALYMESGATSAPAWFATLAADLETLADRLADIPVQELRPYRAAADEACAGGPQRQRKRAAREASGPSLGRNAQGGRR